MIVLLWLGTPKEKETARSVKLRWTPGMKPHENLTGSGGRNTYAKERSAAVAVEALP
jgi:hypothetical protein